MSTQTHSLQQLLVMPFERLWKGKITTSWDNGSSPRRFRLHPTNVTLSSSSSSLKGTFDGDGSSYNGQAFDIKHGKYHIRSSGEVHFSFDIKFVSGAPGETFSGHVNAADTEIKGTIKLKHPDNYDGPQTSGSYGAYRASVTLH